MGVRPVIANPFSGVVDVTDLETGKVPFVGADKDVNINTKSLLTAAPVVVPPLISATVFVAAGE